jgi:hypothetical protein
MPESDGMMLQMSVNGSDRTVRIDPRVRSSICCGKHSISPARRKAAIRVRAGRARSS